MHAPESQEGLKRYERGQAWVLLEEGAARISRRVETWSPTRVRRISSPTGSRISRRVETSWLSSATRVSPATPESQEGLKRQPDGRGEGAGGVRPPESQEGLKPNCPPHCEGGSVGSPESQEGLKHIQLVVVHLIPRQRRPARISRRVETALMTKRSGFASMSCPESQEGLKQRAGRGHREVAEPVARISRRVETKYTESSLDRSWRVCQNLKKG